MDSFMKMFFGPLYNHQYCQLFQGFSIVFSFVIVINIIQMIYLIYTSKNLGKIYNILFILIPLTCSNLILYFMSRLGYGMCLKSLN